MRRFRRLNVVKETTDERLAARYLAEGYQEITEPEKPAGAKKGKGKAAGRKAEADDGEAEPAENAAEPVGE